LPLTLRSLPGITRDIILAELADAILPIADLWQHKAQGTSMMERQRPTQAC